MQKDNFKDYDYYFNFALVGSSSVGKSSIIERYVQGSFDAKSPSTIGYDFKLKQLQIGDKTIKLQIFDTAGQQRYRSIVSGHLKNAHAVFIVYDINNKITFQQIKNVWLQMVNNQLKQQAMIIVFANKCDKQSDDLTQQQKQFLKQKSIKYFRTSALTGLNIKQSIVQIVTDLINKKKPQQTKQTKVVLRTKQHKQKQPNKKKCC